MRNSIIVIILSFLLIGIITHAHAIPFAKTDEYKAIELAWSYYSSTIIDDNAIISEDPSYSFIDDFILAELNLYSSENGVLSNDSKKIIEENISQLQQEWQSNPDAETASQFFYPKRGIAPHNADINLDSEFELFETAGNQAKKKIIVADVIKDLKFERAFTDYYATSPQKEDLTNKESGTYKLIFGPASKTSEAYATEVKTLCTIDTTPSELSEASLIDDISIALYTVSLLEANYQIAVTYRDDFIRNIEEPLKPYYSLAHSYIEDGSKWPESRRDILDQCRSDFEKTQNYTSLFETAKTNDEETAREQARIEYQLNIDNTHTESISNVDKYCNGTPEEGKSIYDLDLQYYTTSICKYLGDSPIMICETRIDACRYALSQLSTENEEQYGYKEWSEVQQKRADEVKADKTKEFQLMLNNAKAIVKEKKRCTSLARSLYSNTKITTWTSCLGPIDQSTIAKTLQKKNKDRYVQYISKKAKTCSGSYSELLAAHNDCKYTSGAHSGKPLSYYLNYQEDELQPECESACFANAPCSYTYGFIDLEEFVTKNLSRKGNNTEQQ
jgi:hypothetical protein